MQDVCKASWRTEPGCVRVSTADLRTGDAMRELDGYGPVELKVTIDGSMADQGGVLTYRETRYWPKRLKASEVCEWILRLRKVRAAGCS
jgi:hypothetical protein